MNQKWTAQVERGKALVSEIGDRKWELGDLANEVCPAGVEGAHDDRLNHFAAEIGISASTLNDYRLVAKSWAPSARALGQTWTTHKALASHPDRLAIMAEQVWTYNSLSERLGRLPNPSRVATPDASVSAAQVRAAIVADPKLVRDAIKNDVRVLSHAEHAVDEWHDEQRKARPATRVREESKNERFTRALTAMRRSSKSLQEFADAVSGGQWTDEEAAAFEPQLRRLADLIEVIRTGFQSGSWDDELVKLLDGQS